MKLDTGNRSFLGMVSVSALALSRHDFRHTWKDLTRQASMMVGVYAITLGAIRGTVRLAGIV